MFCCWCFFWDVWFNISPKCCKAKTTTKNTINYQPWIKVNKMVPAVLFANISTTSQFFVARDQQQSTVFVWRWTAEVARLPKIEAPAWLKGSELVFLAIFFTDAIRTHSSSPWKPKQRFGSKYLFASQFFRLAVFQQSQQISHVFFFRNYLSKQPTAIFVHGSFRKGVFRPKICPGKRWWELGVRDTRGNLDPWVKSRG